MTVEAPSSGRGAPRHVDEVPAVGEHRRPGRRGRRRRCRLGRGRRCRRRPRSASSRSSGSVSPPPARRRTARSRPRSRSTTAPGRSPPTTSSVRLRSSFIRLPRSDPMARCARAVGGRPVALAIQTPGSVRLRAAHVELGPVRERQPERESPLAAALLAPRPNHLDRLLGAAPRSSAASSARPPARNWIRSSGSRPYHARHDRRPQEEHDPDRRERPGRAEPASIGIARPAGDDTGEVVHDVVDAEHPAAVPVGHRLLDHRVHRDLLPGERHAHREARDEDAPVGDQGRRRRGARGRPRRTPRL